MKDAYMERGQVDNKEIVSFSQKDHLTARIKFKEKYSKKKDIKKKP